MKRVSLLCLLDEKKLIKNAVSAEAIIFKNGVTETIVSGSDAKIAVTVLHPKTDEKELPKSCPHFQ